MQEVRVHIINERRLLGHTTPQRHFPNMILSEAFYQVVMFIHRFRGPLR